MQSKLVNSAMFRVYIKQVREKLNVSRYTQRTTLQSFFKFIYYNMLQVC